MGKIKQIKIKNWTYYFYNDIINVKHFESNLLRIDRKLYKNIGIYNIGYITIKKINDCENIYRVNPLYLLLNHVSGYIEEKKRKQILDPWLYRWKQRATEKIFSAWNETKNESKTINGGKENDYKKDYMKIKLNFDNYLPLNKPPTFHSMTIVIRSVFEEDGKFYPQVFLDDTLYQLSI